MSPCDGIARTTNVTSWRRRAGPSAVGHGMTGIAELGIPRRVGRATRALPSDAKRRRGERPSQTLARVAAARGTRAATSSPGTAFMPASASPSSTGARSRRGARLA